MLQALQRGMAVHDLLYLIYATSTRLKLLVFFYVQ